MSEVRELTLKVPNELAERFSGLAIDMGGTLTKFVYRSKDDTEAVMGKLTSTSVLRLVSFRSQLDVSLDYVRQRADLRRNSEDGTVTVRAMGFGSSAFGNTISKKLDVKVENLAEFDSIVRSFVYFSRRLPRSELLEPFQKDAITESIKEMQSMYGAYQASVDAKLTTAITSDTGPFNEAVRRLLERSSKVAEDAAVKIPLTEAEPDIFPCLLVYVGSATSIMRIEKNGSFQVADCLYRNGKSYFGIGKMLTGCQTFDDLIDMASKGNNRNVDQYVDRFIKTGDGGSSNSSSAAANVADDWSSALIPQLPYLLYGFGEAVDSDPGKLKPEDVACSWLKHAAGELARTVQLACHLRRINRVFFAGGFCSRPFVRHVITAEFANRLLLQLACEEVGGYIDFDFVKAGEFLGALGCAVADLQVEP
jgi:pantothenate kinase